MQKNPSTVTIYGRLSFPLFTHAEAVAANSSAPKTFRVDDPTKVKTSFNLLLEDAQLDKLVTHIKDVFLPWVLAEHGKGNDRYKDFDQKAINKILKVVDYDWEDQPPFILIKPVSEKTLELMPEAVASVKLTGQPGQDIILKAIVNDESELAVNDGETVVFPVIKPLNQTTHMMYPGAYVAATINLYVYSGVTPGLSGGANTAVFKADADRFGGGVDVDVDEMFLD